MTSHLEKALGSVDWNSNVSGFTGMVPLPSEMETYALRLAIWSKQLETLESANPAIAFIREMQHGANNVACTVALGLYKPSASSMRAIVECALYFAYFRSHAAELATLVRDEKFYVTKKDIIAFFIRHAPEFQKRQASLSYVDRLERWYSKTSAIVHGQIPGVWSNGTSIAGMKHVDEILAQVVKHFEEAIFLVQDTFLCAIAPELWKNFESAAKAAICKGMSGAMKTALALDIA